MAKEFKRDISRIKKKTNPISETEILEPKKTFDFDTFSKSKTINDNTETTNTKIGRPRKNKVYGTVRLQKTNVHRINALQNTLDYETQDDLISSLLDKIENSLESEQQIMFEMYMKTYISKDKKKDNKKNK